MSTDGISTSVQIGERIREERERLGMTQGDFCASTGVGRKTQFNYETGDRLPDAAYLVEAMRLGVDVIYVLTGGHDFGPEQLYSSSEHRLIARYRAASPEGRAALEAMAAALAAGVSYPGQQPAVSQTFHGSVGNVHSMRDGTMNVTVKKAKKTSEPK